MKNKITILGLLVLGTIAAFAFSSPRTPMSQTGPSAHDYQTAAAPVTSQQDNTNVATQIQIALILDTSNSMDGLIDQAKSQLWKIVNELSKAHKDSTQASVSIALYEYGNSNLSMTNGYIRKVLPFTTDLDDLSEKLFALRTQGGDEYCGQAIHTSLQELDWATNQDGLKVIYIAGNEPFNQGRFSHKEACEMASQQNITVYPIFCGNEQEGLRSNWGDCAKLTAGTFMNINSDIKTIAIATPYDDEISELNVQLNNTYIYYGKEGKSLKTKQSKQDANQEKYSKANSVSRTISKSSHLYSNTLWDLLDAYQSDSTIITKIDMKTLPDSLQTLKETEIKTLVLNKAKERADIQKKIATNATKRSQYISDNKNNNQTETLGDRMIKTIQIEAQKNGFVFN